MAKPCKDLPFKVDKLAAKKCIRAVIPILQKTYPQAECTLDYQTPLQLMIATMLAAQCTDTRVNIVTKDLFKKYRSVEDFAGASLQQLQEDIKSTGFYRNKAASIKSACQKIIADYNRKVPQTMKELLTLKGLGRKTANVVLGNVFGIAGIVCDTHMIRLCRRLRLSEMTNPVKLEFDLMKIVPKKRWTIFSHLIVFHGRGCCKARKPDCADCPVAKYCPAADSPKFW